MHTHRTPASKRIRVDTPDAEGQVGYSYYLTREYSEADVDCANCSVGECVQKVMEYDDGAVLIVHNSIKEMQ